MQDYRLTYVEEIKALPIFVSSCSWATFSSTYVSHDVRHYPSRGPACETGFCAMATLRPACFLSHIMLMDLPGPGSALACCPPGTAPRRAPPCDQSLRLAGLQRTPQRLLVRVPATPRPCWTTPHPGQATLHLRRLCHVT
jgi:hypothetical protein